MLVDGVRLLVLGMGMVFSFLLLLYGCVLLLGQLMARIPLPETSTTTPSRIKPPLAPRAPVPSGASIPSGAFISGDSVSGDPISGGEVIAVISAAVREYRGRNR